MNRNRSAHFTRSVVHRHRDCDEAGNESLVVARIALLNHHIAFDLQSGGAHASVCGLGTVRAFSCTGVRVLDA